MSPTRATLEAAASRTSVEAARLKPKGALGSASKCLLVSSDQDFLDGMSRAASVAGWQCASCRHPEDSLRQAFLNRFGLAIVDIGPAKNRRSLTDLFRLVIDSGSGLVIAYDKRGDPTLELWARENGAWLYVPGIADWEDLSLACREAMRVNQHIRNRDAIGAPA